MWQLLSIESIAHFNQCIRYSYLCKCSSTERRTHLPSSTYLLAIEATWSRSGAAVVEPRAAAEWLASASSSSSSSLVVCDDGGALRVRSPRDTGSGEDEPRSSLSSSAVTPTGAGRPHTACSAAAAAAAAAAGACFCRRNQRPHISCVTNI